MSSCTIHPGINGGLNKFNLKFQISYFDMDIAFIKNFGYFSPINIHEILELCRLLSIDRAMIALSNLPDRLTYPTFREEKEIDYSYHFIKRISSDIVFDVSH